MAGHQFLSDALAEMREQLEAFAHEPRILDPRDACAYVGCLRLMGAWARIMENEISKYRWNEQARLEREADERLLAALSAPGSNVILFGRDVEERSFGDDPRGAA